MAETIETNCPSCSARLRLPAAQAGKQVRCPKCKMVFRIPAEQASADPGFDSMLGGLAPQQPQNSAFGAPPPKDPFAASGPAYQDPFATPGAPDPFAVPQKQDPFGAPSNDPFGSPAPSASPFGVPPAAAPPNPFGAPPPNPFAGPGAPNPYAPNPYAPPGYAPPQGSSGSPLAGISLGTGIAAWLLGCFCGGLNIVLSLAAIITGHIAYARNDNRGMAIAGLILGYLNLVLTVVVIVFYVIVLIAAEGANRNNPNFP